MIVMVRLVQNYTAVQSVIDNVVRQATVDFGKRIWHGLGTGNQCCFSVFHESAAVVLAQTADLSRNYMTVLQPGVNAGCVVRMSASQSPHLNCRLQFV